MHFVTKLMRFTIPDEFWDKTVAYRNTEAEVFWNKLLSHFAIIYVAFCNKVS